MQTVRRTVTIDMPKEAIWAVLGDFKNVGEFHPFITSVDLNTEHNGGLGSKRKCYFNDGTTIEEEIIDWQEGQNYSINGTNFSFPLKKLVATLGVEEIDGTSVASMQMKYEPKFGILGMLMAKLMMNKMMGRRMAKILDGLNERVTTGQPVKRAA